MPCNNGNNENLMLTTRRELNKNEYDGAAWLEVQKMIDLVSSVTEVVEVESVLVTDLITVYKWGVTLCAVWLLTCPYLAS